MDSRDTLEKALIRYQPWNEQEETDRAVMLRLLREQPDIFLRQNQSAHFSLHPPGLWMPRESKR